VQYSSELFASGEVELHDNSVQFSSQPQETYGLQVSSCLYFSTDGRTPKYYQDGSRTFSNNWSKIADLLLEQEHEVFRMVLRQANNGLYQKILQARRKQKKSFEVFYHQISHFLYS
jgi:hypothetical protein